MKRFTVEITKELHDQLSEVDFNSVSLILKTLSCTINLDGEGEKDHKLTIEMEIPEENQMNIDKLETQTPEEEGALANIGGTVLSGSDFVSAKEVHLRDYQKKTFPANSEGVNEWSGEGLPPVGAFYTVYPNHDVELLCKYSSKYVVIGEMLPKERYNGVEVVIDTFGQRNREFRKPETPQQREDRERLEAAYDLYESAQHEIDCIGYDSFELFKKSEVQVKFWLAIVDKTKYRKVVK